MENSITSKKGASRRCPRPPRPSQSLGLPTYTLGEELCNAITHGIGTLLAATALVLLLVASPGGNPLRTVSLVIYGATLILLYLFSTLYHSLRPNRAKKVFRVIDHCSIYLLIAGTYTPFSLLVIGGGWGIGIFIAVWVCALLGITLNAISLERFKGFSMVSYIGMGWCIVLVFSKLTAALSLLSINLLLLGGVLYTAGALLYAFGKRVRYMHSLWHLFVLTGSVVHFFSIYHFIRG